MLMLILSQRMMATLTSATTTSSEMRLPLPPSQARLLRRPTLRPRLQPYWPSKKQSPRQVRNHITLGSNARALTYGNSLERFHDHDVSSHPHLHSLQLLLTPSLSLCTTQAGTDRHITKEIANHGSEIVHRRRRQYATEQTLPQSRWCLCSPTTPRSM